MDRSKVLVVLAGAALTASALAAGNSPDADRAYSAELLADASARTSRLNGAEGLTFADGGSTVRVGGFTQFRYNMNFRDDPAPGADFHDSGFTSGFEATRTRLEVTGTIVDPNLSFKVDADFDKEGDSSLKDAYGYYKWDNGFGVKFGQFKLPILREELVGDTWQLAMDRSVVNTVFTQDRSQGVQFSYETDQFRILGAVSDGVRTRNTPYTSPAEADWALSARGEYQWGADWKRFASFTSWKGDPFAGLIGGAIHYEQAGNTASTASVPQGSFALGTIDLSLEGDGWNIYAAIVGDYNDLNSGGDSTTDFGVVAQGGYFFTNQIEGFARWDWVIPDSDSAGGDDDFHTLGFGGNWYAFEKSNACKLTAQIDWFLNDTENNGLVSAIADNNNNGLRPSGEDNQFALRFQFQLVF